jgi:hypothetical protein
MEKIRLLFIYEAAIHELARLVLRKRIPVIEREFWR